MVISLHLSKLVILAALLACLTSSTYAQSTNISCDLSSPSSIKILLNSGSFINDIGNYEACTGSNTSQWLSGTIFKNSTYIGFVGLCVPSSCTPKLLMANETLLSQIPVLKSILEINYTIVINLPVVEYQLDFYFYLIIILLTFFVICAIIGTFQPYAGINWENNKSHYDSITYGTVDNLNTSTYTKVSPTPAEKFFECFNAIKNLKKLFNTQSLEGHDLDIGIFNGMRTLSFFYVVYGHEYLERGLGNSAVNPQIKSEIQEGTIIVFIASALYAVDVFFFLSGFYVAFVMTEKLKKLKPSILNYLSLLFHRYIRIMPLYIMVIFIYWKLSVLFGSGPLWPNYISSINYICEYEWWEHLLFVDNLTVTNNNYCFGWGWYLACDFQMFIFTPFLLWLYVYNQKLGKIVITAFLTVLVAGTLVVTFVDKIIIYPLTAGGNSNSWYYQMPYTRAAPYFFGLVFSLLYKEWKSSENREWHITLISQSRIFRILVSFVGIGIILFVIWIVTPLTTNPDAWSNNISYIWSAISRLLFVIGVALFSLPSLFGKNRFFTAIFNNDFFLVMARISYCGYLVHLIIIEGMVNNQKGEFIPTNLDMFYDWSGTMMITTFLSIVLIVLIESPCVNLEITYLTKRHVKKVLDIEKPSIETKP